MRRYSVCLLLMLLAFVATGPVGAQVLPAPVQTYYVPLPEAELFNSTFEAINGPAANPPVNSLISIAVAAAGTLVYYDHWEDGYDPDVTGNPQASTLIWGDGDTTNGTAPDTGGTDVFAGGEAIVLENQVPVPRGSSILFDGRDRIQASFPVAVTRGAFPEDPGSLMAGGVEVLAVDAWGDEFVVPVGEDTPNDSGTDPFETTQLYVMAELPGTQVSRNGNLVGTIGQGENLTIGNIDQGDVLTSNRPVQVDLVAGDIGSTYELRWYSLPPRDCCSFDYYTPVAEEVGSTGIWLYNPNNSDITVRYDRDGATSQGPFTVPANDRLFLEIDDGADIDLPNSIGERSGLRFFSEGNAEFYALTQTDADDSGQIFDWGHPLIPASELTSQALIGWGYGCTGNNCGGGSSRSVVWVTPVSAATINIDFDGDGTVDNTVSARALEQVVIVDDTSVYSGAENDDDMSGALIFATDGGGNPVDIAVAWGQDPDRSGSGDALALDLGTVVPPLPVIDADKSVAVADDVDGDGLPSPGDRFIYTIRVVNVGRFDVAIGELTIEDVLPAETTYVPSSTVYDDGISVIPVADAGSTGFPLDEGGITNPSVLPAGGAHEIRFEVDVDTFPDLAPGTTDIINEGQVTQTGFPPIEFEVETPLNFRTDILIEKATNGVDADNPTGPDIPINDPVTWTYQVSTSGNVFLAAVSVTDSIAGVNPVFQSGDDGDGILEPGEIWIYEASGTAQIGQYANIGTATGDPVYVDGTTPVPDLPSPIDTDPSHYFGTIAPDIDLQKLTNGEDADVPTGPVVPVGSTVTFTYEVENTGNVDLTDVTVTDDQLDASAIDCGGDGDNVIPSLAAGASTSCSATTIATEGQYTNIGTATGTPPTGEPPTVTDPSNHFGATPGLLLQKLTNGEDADVPTGPVVPVGSTVTFTYEVENTGNVDLTDVTVTDDQLDASAIDCGGDGDNVIPSLAAGASTSCSATTIATEGQYTNIGTATGTPPTGEPPTVTDPSNHFGATPGLLLQKLTNGEDADVPTGPVVPVGSTVTFTYEVENTGNVDLTDVTVTDDQLDASAIDCGGDGDNVIPSLAAGASTSCSATTIATEGQYTNIGTATGTPPTGEPPTVTDPSNHFGATPGLLLQKLTNGEDADVPTGPVVPVGSTVTFTYEVENTGNVDLTDVTVTDDQLDASAIDCGGDGDNVIPSLAAGASTSCSATTIATEGQYTNIGTATGTPPTGEPPTVTDPSNHFGATPGLLLQKLTNGEDADVPTGPVVPVGSTVTFTYEVENTGNVDLTDVTVTDDQLDASAIDCGGDGDNVIPSLAAGASTSCSATTIATEGQYTNIGTATGTPPTGEPPTVTDPSNHFGATPGLLLQKLTNGEDADVPTGPVVPVGSTVTFTYEVENTGNVDLTDVTVTDDQLDASAIDCGGDGDNVIPSLAAGASTSCSATTIATEGQYTNIGTATGTPPTGEPPTVTDPSNHFGATPGLLLQKLTNGEDADVPTGPVVPVGSTVTFTYEVENTGNVDLTDVTVTDDQLDASAIDCGGDGDNVIPSLAAGASTSCSATTIATEGQYTNIGTATGTPPTGEPPTVTDPSNHFGATPGLLLQKLTNGEDADVPTGPVVPVGSTVTFTYEVENTGNVDLTDVTVTDDQLDASAIDCGGDGDNVIPSLAAGASTSCSATTIATEGQYTNIGTATGTPPTGEPPTVTDPSNHFGATPGLLLQKLTNGEDADVPTGPVVPVGSTVTFTYEVENTGNVDLTDVTVTDDQLDASAIDCGGDGDNVIPSLAAGASTSCSATTIATEGQYTNIGTATGTPPTGEPPTVTDPSNHFGATPGLLLQKLTNGEDADVPTGPVVPVGSTVTFTYEVENTGNVDLTDVTVTDDQLDASAIDCGGDGDNVIPSLAAGASTSCSATTIATEGQYTNIGTATGTPPTGEPPTVTDPSNHFGATPGLLLQKLTNGEDADVPTGPVVPVGSTVTFTYEVENTGNVDLTDVTVTDDQLDASAIDCGGDGDNVIPSLAAGASTSCSATTIATEGQYTNIGTATGTPPTGEPPTVTDPSNHFGATPGLLLQKLTNGEDADVPTGPVVPVGSTVTFTYEVENTGNVDLTDVTVTDDQLDASAIDCGGDGDNVIPSLAAGASTSCSATTIATEGQYTNIGTATGTPPTGEPPTVTDPSNHFGATPGLLLQKLTNGEDADVPTGPVVPVGSTVTFTYEVENTGNVDLTDVTVTDDQLDASAIDCGGDGDNVIPSLAAGASTSCSATTIATEGQYTNIGTATGTPPTGEPPTVTDPSNHFGATPGLLLQKLTNGEDADVPTGPVVPVGSTVTFTYEVENTGNVDLTDVTVTDDQLDASAIDCGGDGDNVIPSLAAGASTSCSATTIATEGQYTNIGTATGTPPTGEPPTVTDPSNHFGATPGLLLQKLTNGEDADVPTGPVVPVGSTVTFTYEVENTGNVDLTDVTVTDDQLDASAIDCGGDGDNVIPSLAAGASTSCSATTIATEGQYTNIGTATGTPPTGEPPTVTDPSNHFGATPGLLLQKLTNGEDADVPTGPVVPVGSTVTFTYEVENTGNVDLTDVTVTDDQLDASAIDCGGDGDNVIPSLAAGASTSCSATTIATEGQYTNIGTATGTPPTGEPPTVTDPSNHFGATPGLLLQKLTNGEDADVPTGPVVPVGSTVTFTYEVENTGNVDLTDVTVTDDQLDASAIDCGGDGDNVIPSLAAGASTSCSATTIATEGQYTNIGTATGTPPTGEPPTVTDPSNHFGATPGLLLQKLTNGEDADVPTGPVVPVGSTVTFTYEVENTGNVDLTDVTVTDDQLDASAIDCGGDGDNVIPSLAAGASTSCSATTIATEGQYTNIGTATGTPPTGEPPTVTDPSNHFGATPGLLLQKLTNGEDADVPTGPVVPVGSTVTFTYEVENTGNVDLTDVTVTDDQLDASAIDCGGDGDNVIPSLAAGASTSCSASITATAGQYTNIGTATGTPPTGEPPTVTDPSNHFGATPGLLLQKLTNGEDADVPTGPVVPVGSTVTFTYEVENTGNVDLTDVTVTDDQLDASAIDCGGDGDNVIPSLAAGASTSCSASITATAGQYTNIGTATGTPPTGEPPIDTDPSNHFGEPPPARVCDVDADGDIDRTDITLISRLRGQTVPPASPEADSDGDGVITFLDVKICIPRIGT